MVRFRYEFAFDFSNSRLKYYFLCTGPEYEPNFFVPKSKLGSTWKNMGFGFWVINSDQRIRLEKIKKKSKYKHISRIMCSKTFVNIYKF